MMKKALKKDTPRMTSSECTPTAASSGSSSSAKAGSPTQPRPREARVMPNWQALLGDGLHAGGAQLDHSELGGNEEAVEQDEEEGEEYEAEIGEIGQQFATGGRVHGSVG